MTINDNFINCCFTSSLLVIHQFSQNEIGYYWCQIITPNRHLQKSPYAFISLHHETVLDPQTCTVNDYINHLNPPICAIDRNYTSHTERRICISSDPPSRRPLNPNTTTIALHTTNIPLPTYHNLMLATTAYYETSHATTKSSFMSTSESVTTVVTSQSPWVYIVLTGVIIVLFVVMLCFIILYCKHKAPWKRGRSTTLLCVYTYASIINRRLTRLCKKRRPRSYGSFSGFKNQWMFHS